MLGPQEGKGVCASGPQKQALLCGDLRRRPPPSAPEHSAGGGVGGHVDRSILPPRTEHRPTAETQVTGAGPGGRPGPGRGEGSREGEATAS